LASEINNLYADYIKYKQKEVERSSRWWYKLSFEDFMNFIEKYSNL
jgi:hypothetical protein